MAVIGLGGLFIRCLVLWLWIDCWAGFGLFIWCYFVVCVFVYRFDLLCGVVLIVGIC